MKRLITITAVILMVLALSACGNPAKGTIEGKIVFEKGILSPTMLLCQVSEFTGGTLANDEGIEYYIVSDGWSATEGFDWGGNVSAPGFACTVVPDLESEIWEPGKFLDGGEDVEFSFTDLAVGEYAFIVLYQDGMNSAATLVRDENSVPVVIELTAKQGVDTGLLTVHN